MNVIFCSGESDEFDRYVVKTHPDMRLIII